jgi:hypothetical protein
MNLSMQRLDYCRGVGCTIQYSKLMEESYNIVLEDLKRLKTDDPSIVHLLSNIEEQVNELLKRY